LDGLDASVEGLENGDEGLNNIVEEAGDEGLEDENDDEEEEELQEVRQKVREVEGKTSRKAKETVLDETESESSRKQFEAEVPKKVEVEGLNDRVGREEEGNRTEYFDSDDHESILGSDDNDNIDTCKRKRRRSRFPTYNPNSTSPHFCIGMLFNDGEQFKSAIRKYSMCCRRELKIIKNEPNKGPPKMKLREIQRRVALEMHVNVNMIRCRRAQKIVKDKLKGNFIEEFAML
ncbi:hypothetical protein Golax_022113, partial [Gossypium laxum]|nr:hypothetical protein [Gossypium laxum]